MAVKITKSGNTILSDADYTALRERVHKKQGGRCADCGRRMEFSHLHHTDGRSRGQRDDAEESTKLLCPRCHGQRHGQIK